MKKIYQSPTIEMVRIDKDINVCVASNPTSGGIGGGGGRPDRPPRPRNSFEANPFEQNSFKQNPFAK